MITADDRREAALAAAPKMAAYVQSVQTFEG